mgnify:CR=1 FL=1
MLFIASIVNLGFIYREQNITHYATITEISTKAYSGDSSAYSELFELLDGQIISVVKSGKNWSQIKYDGALGWIANDSFEAI